MRRLLGDVHAVHPDTALVRRVKAGQGAQQSGFAAARGPQQGEELAVLHGQVNLVQNSLRAEALAHLLDMDFEIHVMHLKKAPQKNRRG